MMYFDSAATSLYKPPAVARAVSAAMGRCASVGRGGHEAAQEAAKVVFACREEAASLFDAQPEQVVFTMNATHGLNVAIRSLCKSGMRVAISGFEHNAVLRPLHALGAEIMVTCRELFTPEEAVYGFEQALRGGAELAVCTCCSNVFGYVLPTDQIAALCRSYGVPLILDASQAAGALPVSLQGSGAAFIAMPGHKGLYGPQGTGLLLCARSGEPLLFGGTGGNSAVREMPEFLPDRLEAGTHNVCGIAGLLEGLRYVRARTLAAILRKERRMLRQLLQGLPKMPELRVFAGKGQSGVLSVCRAGMDCEELAERFARRGIALRAGLHCAPLAHRSAGTFDTGTLRISFSDRNSPAQVRTLTEVCKKLFS